MKNIEIEALKGWKKGFKHKGDIGHEAGYCNICHKNVKNIEEHNKDKHK